MAYLALYKRPFELPRDASDTLRSFFKNVRTSLIDPGNVKLRLRHWSQDAFEGVVDRQGNSENYFNPLKSILRVFGNNRIWWAEGFNPEILSFQLNNDQATDEDLRLFVETAFRRKYLLQRDTPKPTLKTDQAPEAGLNTSVASFMSGKTLNEEFFGEHEGQPQLPTDVKFWEFLPPKNLLRTEDIVRLEPPSGSLRFAVPLTHKKSEIAGFIDRIIGKYPGKTHDQYWSLFFDEKYPFLVNEDDEDELRVPDGKGLQAIKWLCSDPESDLTEARLHNIESHFLTKTREDDESTVVAERNAEYGLRGTHTHSAYKFNGKNLILLSLQKQTDEDRVYECKFCESDYYTYRCLARCSDSILNRFRLREELGQGGKRLQQYLAAPLFIHGGFGVAVMVRTSDNMLVIRKRSGGAADFGESYKLYMSTNEGLRANLDVEHGSSGALMMKPCIEIVKRALRNELVGEEGDGGLPLDERNMKSCYLTGALLYLPNLSINLCFFVDLAGSFEQIKWLADRVPKHSPEFLSMEK